MTNTLQERVSLPQGRRSPGGVLAVAEPLPPGWEQGGVTFRGIGCAEPETLGVCDVIDRTAVRPDTAPIFEPIFIAQSAACSLLSQIGTVNISSDRLEATTDWGLGRLLATGLGTNNPSLQDATTIHAGTGDDVATEVINAVSCLEQGAADLGFGAEVVLHAPVRAAAFLAAARLNVGGRSPAGHPWIISAGYPVDAESGEDTIVTIYATGTVWAGVSEAYVLENGNTGRPQPGWRINLDEAYAQRLGLAAFDPCLLIAASFTVPACIGGS